jgi:AraC-like DNA-binding protein
MTIATNDLPKFEAVKQLISGDITKHYSIPELSAKAEINQFKLKAGFKKLYGQPLFRYLQELRIEKAIELLMNTDMDVRDIAIKCGYGWSTNFAAAFRRKFKLTPSEFRTRKDTTVLYGA